MNSTASSVMTALWWLMSGIAPAKAHLAVVEAEESSVGDGDAVGVAGQILEHVFGAAKGRLGVDSSPH